MPSSCLYEHVLGSKSKVTKGNKETRTKEENKNTFFFSVQRFLPEPIHINTYFPHVLKESLSVLQHTFLMLKIRGSSFPLSPSLSFSHDPQKSVWRTPLADPAWALTNNIYLIKSRHDCSNSSLCSRSLPANDFLM